MKRNFYTILIIIIICLVATACTKVENKNNENNNVIDNIIEDNGIYKIERITFTEDANKAIIYPQILEMNDKTKNDNINDILKNSAFTEYDLYGNDKTDLSNEMNYTITMQSENIFCVVFDGYAFFKGAAHPQDIITTTNIDIKEERNIILNEIITIDEILINNILVYELKEEDKNDVTIAALEYLKSMTNESLTSYLNSDTAVFYLKQDSIVISFEVIHAIGDHLEIEFYYNEINDNIKEKNMIWSEILVDWK